MERHTAVPTPRVRAQCSIAQSVDLPRVLCRAVGGREKRQEWDLLNDNKAIWLRKPSEVTEEEYQKFYKAVSKVGRTRGPEPSLLDVGFLLSETASAWVLGRFMRARRGMKLSPRNRLRRALLMATHRGSKQQQ